MFTITITHHSLFPSPQSFLCSLGSIRTVPGIQTVTSYTCTRLDILVLYSMNNFWFYVLILTYLCLSAPFFQWINPQLTTWLELPMEVWLLICKWKQNDFFLSISNKFCQKLHNSFLYLRFSLSHRQQCSKSITRIFLNKV